MYGEAEALASVAHVRILLSENLSRRCQVIGFHGVLPLKAGYPEVLRKRAVNVLVALYTADLLCRMPNVTAIQALLH